MSLALVIIRLLRACTAALPLARATETEHGLVSDAHETPFVLLVRLTAADRDRRPEVQRGDVRIALDAVVEVARGFRRHQVKRANVVKLGLSAKEKQIMHTALVVSIF